MIALYASRVLTKKMTIDDVPDLWREGVAEFLGVPP
jgi:hypothetical protein